MGDSTRLTEDLDLARVRALSSALDAGVLLLSVDGKLEFASNGALELLGFPTFESLGEHWIDILTQVEHAAGIPWRQRPTWSLNAGFTVRGKTRSIRWEFHRSEAEICDAYVVLLRSSELAQTLEGELRLAAQFLSLSRVFRANAHQLRDPLNSIALNLELLKAASPAGSRTGDEPARALGVIDKEFRGFLTTFQTFLRLGQPSGDQRSSFDFRDLIEDLVAMLAPPAQEQRVTLRLQKPEVEVPFEGGRSQLLQALLLLGIHGLDAMPDGGELELRLDRIDDSIRVLISDTGTSIAPEHSLKVWDIHLTTRKGSTGIGLHVARSILQEHGGVVEIERRSPEGTRVGILLPPIRGGTSPKNFQPPGR